MKTARGNAGPIVVEEQGEGGVPIVLIHGMAGDTGFWRTTLAALSTQGRVIIPELRGHGRSALPVDGDHAIASHADDMLQVLDQLDVERFVAVGHSFGASVAIEMARMAPTRVAGLVIIDGAGDFTNLPAGALDAFRINLDSDEHFLETVEGAIDVALLGAQPGTELTVRAAMLAAPRPMVRAIYHALLSYRPALALAAYPGPVLLLSSPSNSADFALHALLPNLPHRAVPGVSHWIMMDAPEEVALAIDTFTRSIPS